MTEWDGYGQCPQTPFFFSLFSHNKLPSIISQPPHIRLKQVQQSGLLLLRSYPKRYQWHWHTKYPKPCWDDRYRRRTCIKEHREYVVSPVIRSSFIMPICIYAGCFRTIYLPNSIYIANKFIRIPGDWLYMVHLWLESGEVISVSPVYIYICILQTGF